MNTTSITQALASLATLQSSLTKDASTALQQKTGVLLSDFSTQLQTLLAHAQPSASTPQVEIPSAPSVSVLTAPATNKESHLLAPNADMALARDHKPNTYEFMQATGVDFDTASSTLYGVVGSNTDYRDWDAIMATANPLAAARAATGAMYANGSTDSATAASPLPSEAIKAQSGHFAWAEIDGKQNLWLLDGQNAPLRQLNMDAPTILRASRDFGFDTANLAQLGQKLDALGVAYRPGEMAAGSDHGIDLKALASGKLGTLYDWTVDPLVHLKGESALQRLRANQALAAELGLSM